MRAVDAGTPAPNARCEPCHDERAAQHRGVTKNVLKRPLKPHCGHVPETVLLNVRRYEIKARLHRAILALDSHVHIHEGFLEDGPREDASWLRALSTDLRQTMKLLFRE